MKSHHILLAFIGILIAAVAFVGYVSFSPSLVALAEDPVYGCTDPSADNYDPGADTDNGSCTYPPIYGCTDPMADNYDPSADTDDGSCYQSGCTDPAASNYNPGANTNDGSCTYPFYGCTDPAATNYDPSADTEDGTCAYPVYGCTDPAADNYNPIADTEDGSCIYTYYGCTDPAASNYDPGANTDDGTCNYYPPGAVTGLTANVLISDVEFSWNMPELYGGSFQYYNVYQDGNNILSPSTESFSMATSEFATRTPYEFCVAAVTNAGEGELSCITVTINPPAAGDISFYITRDSTENPLEGAEVTIQCQGGIPVTLNGVTDSGGFIGADSLELSTTYAAANCFSGDYVDIRVTKTGYITYDTSRLIDEVDFSLSVDSSLFVRVGKEENGTLGLDGATISVGPFPVSCSYEGDGLYYCPVTAGQGGSVPAVTISKWGYVSRTIYPGSPISTTSQTGVNTYLPYALRVDVLDRYSQGVIAPSLALDGNAPTVFDGGASYYFAQEIIDKVLSIFLSGYINSETTNPALLHVSTSSSAQTVIALGNYTNSIQQGLSSVFAGASVSLMGLDPVVSGCTEPAASNYNPGANTNDGSCVYSEGRSLVVLTNPATNVTSTSATLNGTIVSNGQSSIMDRGFNIGLDTNYTGMNLPAALDEVPGFSVSIELECATTYHFRAYATNNEGTSYGEDQVLGTDACSGEVDSSTKFVSTIIGPAELIFNGSTTNLQPTFDFSIEDPDHSIAGTGYLFALLTSPVVEAENAVIVYFSERKDQGAMSFTVGQPEGGGQYQLGSEGQQLVLGQKYYWLVAAAGPRGTGQFAFAWDYLNPTAYSFEVVSPAIAPSQGAPVRSVGIVGGGSAGGYAWKPATPLASQPFAPAKPKSYHFPRTLKKGMKGDDVVVLQKFLKVAPVSSKIFGPATEAALKKFQKSRGLQADGVLGPKTRVVIEDELNK